MQHTPGPWRVQKEEDGKIETGSRWGDHGTTVFSRSNTVAFVYKKRALFMGGEKIVEEFEANARLIEAAPDLIEALRAITDACQYLPNKPVILTKRIQEAKAAISKATTP